MCGNKEGIEIMLKQTGMGLAVLSVAAGLSACATNPNDIAASYVSPTLYMGLSCDQLREEAIRVSNAASIAVGAQDEKVTQDAVAMGVGLVLFWPALFFIGGGGTTESEVAQLRGEMTAIEQASIQKNCGIVFSTEPEAG